MEFPVEIGCENGVRKFRLNKQLYLNAGELLDMMMSDKDICLTGCFIGQLDAGCAPSKADVTQNISVIKNSIRKTSRKNVKHSASGFNPTLQRRNTIVPEKNVFMITPCAETPDIKKMAHDLREEFRNNVLGYDFLRENGKETDLEKVFRTEGMEATLDRLFDIFKSQPEVMYAVDITLSEHLKTTQELSISNMKCFLSRWKESPTVGISCPSVFIGQMGTTFSPHIEDCAFQNVNRHVAGAPKIWFIVPPRFYMAFNQMLKRMGVPYAERTCSVPLSHINNFIDPRIVVLCGIPVFTVIQRPGDILYLLPFTIHFGFNLGINCNEVKNLASSKWAKYGMIAPERCLCTRLEQDSLEENPDEVFAKKRNNFDILPILQDIGVDDHLLEDFQNGWLVNVLDITDVMHPESGLPFSSKIQLTNLLGPNYKNEIGQKLLVKDAQEEVEDGGVRDQEEEVEDGGVGDQEEEVEDGGVVDQEEEDEEENEQEEDHPTRKAKRTQHRRTVTCPKPDCDKEFQGGHIQRLRKHIDKCHGRDPEHPQLLEKFMEMCPPRNKTAKKECSVCGKQIAGRATQMRLHQQSSGCRN